MNKTDFDRLTENERLNCILEGTAYFASVHKPNDSGTKKFKAPPKYTVKLGLTPEGVAKAKGYGLKVLDADATIPMPQVEIKMVVKEGKSAESVKPQVVDAMQQPVPAHILIGNGSKIICKFGRYWYDNNGGGIGTNLFKVQIKELVEFKPTERGFVMDEGGFTVDTSAASDEFDE